MSPTSIEDLKHGPNMDYQHLLLHPVFPRGHSEHVGWSLCGVTRMMSRWPSKGRMLYAIGCPWYRWVGGRVFFSVSNWLCIQKGSTTWSHLHPLAWLNLWRLQKMEWHIYSSTAKLREMCASKGAMPDNKVIVYCFKGARAFNEYIALKEAGFSDVSNYFGLWNEWSRDHCLEINLKEMELRSYVKCTI